MMVLILAALLPPFFLLRYIYRLDKVEKEPRGLLVRLFVFGVISVLPAMVLELALAPLLEEAAWSLLSWHILDNFLGVALVEEGCKYFFLKKTTWRHEAFNFRFDAVVYAAVVSLGFAAAENVFYVLDSGMSTALVRAVTSIPGHMIFGIYMGVYYGRAKLYANAGETDRAARGRLLAIVIPVLLHGTYDLMLSLDNEYILLAFIGYLIILDILALRSLKRGAREDAPL